ncbi:MULTISPECIES: helix-turn-helix domain-containing protein [Spirosoma]|uniref:Helix-turn-helix, AraC domain protein n=1 Tax=Spirosoma linguale (strain ATCC 33905 / DSM 74 / LMG 10896 / Claus 1) TaxID=504472 RepID=D2QVJ0_SPILD|nr:helix-turn-helix domain-containing protein [Spirosoma sp. 209]ADB42822.1 Helix-turn-helix, AraC domain protein [Spirosoma linguale DSM 74]
MNSGLTIVPVKGLTNIGLVERIRHELSEAGFRVTAIRPGRITLQQTGSWLNLEPLLGAWGVFLLDEREQQVIEHAKNGLANSLAQRSLPLRSLLKHLREQTRCPYEQLNDLFLATEGMTFGRYVVLQRLDKVIERLTYSNATITEIARQTGYRNEAHLIRHLDAERGLPPAHFLALRDTRMGQEPHRLVMAPVGIN